MTNNTYVAQNACNCRRKEKTEKKKNKISSRGAHFRKKKQIRAVGKAAPVVPTARRNGKSCTTDTAMPDAKPGIK